MPKTEAAPKAKAEDPDERIAITNPDLPDSLITVTRRSFPGRRRRGWVETEMPEPAPKKTRKTPAEMKARDAARAEVDTKAEADIKAAAEAKTKARAKVRAEAARQSEDDAKAATEAKVKARRAKARAGNDSAPTAQPTSPEGDTETPSKEEQ